MLRTLVRFRWSNKPLQKAHHSDANFIDRIHCTFRGGRGGAGAAGQLGGAGGVGGDVILVGQQSMSMRAFHRAISKAEKSYRRRERDASLIDHRLDDVVEYPIIEARNGANCRGQEKWGRNGQNATLRVPLGIRIRRVDTGEVIGEINRHKETCVIAQGGDPGRGIRGAGLSRREFKSESEKRRVIAENRGKRGEQINTWVEARQIGHVGLVGYTNAGKSTLLRALTSMNVEIASTAMTTLRPNRGHIDRENEKFGFIIADLPGLIDGAHRGAGVGEHFLSMIERNRTHLIVIDINGFQLDADAPKRDAFDSLMLILGELLQYDPGFLERKCGLILNKCERDCKELISTFKWQLANQEKTKQSRQYPIPIPQTSVDFSFVDYIAAIDLNPQAQRRIISQLRSQLSASGFAEERPQKITVLEPTQRLSASLKQGLTF